MSTLPERTQESELDVADLITDPSARNLFVRIWDKELCDFEQKENDESIDQRPTFNTKEEADLMEYSMDDDERDEEMPFDRRTQFSLRMELRVIEKETLSAGIKFEDFRTVRFRHAIALRCIQNLQYISLQQRKVIADALIFTLAEETREDFEIDDAPMDLYEYAQTRLVGLHGLRTLYRKILHNGNRQ